MKKQSTDIFTEGLGSTEASATNHNQISKHLTAADLWNIQRHGKRRIQRRMIF